MGTVKMRPSELRVVVGKVILPIVLLVVAGIAMAGYVVFRGETSKTASQTMPATATAPWAAMPVPSRAVGPASAAMPAPETATANPMPAVAEPVPGEPTRAPLEAVPAVNVGPAPATTLAPSGQPAAAGSRAPPASAATVVPAATLVDVRIDSTPSGAQVLLVDRGKPQFVGSTPVNATVDGSREYDLVFTYPNRPTQVEHLDARTIRRVAIVLGARVSKAKATRGGSRRAEKARAESAPVSPIKKPGKPAAEPVAGEGTLMISSKPPCGIVIDGKPTGLMTPQISIPLSAGSHTVTLVNPEKDIEKTVSVRIAPNTTEKIIEDLME
jgi:hypothetical protein